jgi:hypothetical protein
MWKDSIDGIGKNKRKFLKRKAQNLFTGKWKLSFETGVCVCLFCGNKSNGRLSPQLSQKKKRKLASSSSVIGHRENNYIQDAKKEVSLTTDFSSVCP